MIKNADFVEKILTNTIYGKKAQNGFDLSLKEVKLSGEDEAGRVSLEGTQIPSYTPIICDRFYTLSEGVYSITFNEGGRIPQGYCAWIKTRSSLIRCGSIIESGLYDTGFECENFGAMLFVNSSIIIEQNARVAQIILFGAEDTVEYNGQWQGNKDIK